MSDARQLRVRRLRMAIGSSSLAKLVAIGVQVIAIPLAVLALGVERYGAFLGLTAVLGWISFVDLGVGPGLILGLSREFDEGAEVRRAHLVNTAFQLMAGFTVIVGVAVATVGCLWTVAEIFGPSYQPYALEMQTSALWMVILVLLQLLLSPVEAVRSGYQEQHVSNFLQVFAGAVSGIGLIVVARHAASMQAMVVVLYAPTVASKLINAILLFCSRPYLIPGRYLPDFSLARSLLTAGGMFTLVQFGSLIEQYGILYVVGRFGNTQDVAEFGVMVKLVSLLAGGALMVTQSLWPAYSDALARGDVTWIRKIYRMTAIGSLIAAAGSIGGASFGPFLVEVWTHGKIIPSYSLCFAMAGVLAVGIWTHVHYMTLVGVGDLRAPALVMILRAVVALLLALWAVPQFAVLGAAFALLSADALIAGVYLSRRTTRSLLQLHTPS